MKKETIFPARYELIKLYRKAVHDVETYETPENSQIMLAMDYFDALEVCRFDSDTDKFNEFMGLSIYEDLTEHDVAMQSIPLYCPELSGNTIEEYRCMNKCFKDPFDSEANEFGYFGMINVYITPEILVRFDRERFEESSVKDDNSIYLRIYNAFFKDIHILMSEFVRQKFPSNGQDEFRYRIYQSMSVGDFVVAMRCKEPEVPFEVASMLRRRRYDFKEPVTSNGNKEYTNFVFYKTYTLMSVNTQIIRADTVFNGSEKNDAEKNERSTRKFVLRCVLSNNYWSNEKAINEKFSSESIFNVSSCLRLNGRYDFTVTLSENAFLYIHPKLVQYKIGQQGKTDDSVVQQNSDKVINDGAKRAIILEDAEELRACEIIEFLIENKYISYVNERFLFRDNNGGIDASDYNREITLKKTENEFRFANEINAENLIKLRDSIRKEYQRVLRIDTSRRSVIYSMRLLERFVSICNSINGISDSRIYCSIIIKQMQIVLEGAKWYLTYLGIPYRTEDELQGKPECNNEEYYELISALDTDLKEALEYMNSFAKYILDSSLQSLQTPHFNLETHVSVEKLLLSYSFFVQSFFNWYSQTDMNKKIGGNSSMYYTLMVPQSIDSSLSTKTLFNWKKYNDLQLRLLVVLCPSFNDLTNFPASVGSLLHEIAHSLRYEDRETRNKTILRYGRELLFDQVCENIAVDLRNNIPGVSNDYEYYLESIRRLLSAAYERHIVQEVNHTVMNFTTLCDVIKEEYCEFVDVIKYLARLRRLLQTLLKDVDFRLNSEYRELLMYSDKFYQLYFGDELGENHETKEYIDAYSNLVLSIEQFELDHKQREADGSNETKNLIIRLKDYLFNLAYIEEDENEVREHLDLCKRVIEFEYEVNSAFRRLLMDQRDQINSRAIARYLKQGTYADLDGREDSFASYAESYIILCQAASIENYVRMLDIYKEIASDLYMVKLLGLTPFGYLNFYTWNIPVDDFITETYLRRFCIVLFALTVLGKNERREQSYDWDSIEDEVDKEIRKMCRSVFKHVSEFTRKYSDSKYADVLCGNMEIQNSGDVLHISDYLKQINRKATACIDDSETDDQMTNLYLISIASCAIKDSLEYSSERNIAIEQERFVTELMHCRYLCSNLVSLIYEFKQQIQSIKDFEYLADDLNNGCCNLNKFHDEFKKSYMWRYCGHFAEVYNEEESQPMDRADANKLIAEFVLDMNYSLLYSNAFSMIK